VQKAFINSRQSIVTFTMVILGGCLITDGAHYAGRHIGVAALASLATALPLYLACARTASLYPRDSLFGMTEKLFGKTVSKVLIGIFVVYALHSAALGNIQYSLYSSNTIFEKTHPVFLILPLTGGCIFLGIGRAGVLGRMGRLLFILTGALLVLLSICSLPYMETENLRPVLQDWSKASFFSSTRANLAYPFGDAIVLLTIAGAVKQGQSRYKAMLLPLLLGGGIFIAISMRDVMILGEYAFISSWFPSSLAISRVSVSNYVQNIQLAEGFVFLFCVFIRTGVFLYGACKGLQYLLSLQKKPIIMLSATILPLSAAGIWFLDTPNKMFEYIYRIYPMAALPFQFLFILIIWLAAERKSREITSGL